MRRLHLYIIAIAATIMLMACCVCVSAKTVESGYCGGNGYYINADILWTFDDSGTLFISGSGDMIDCVDTRSVPWYSFREEIKNVVFEGNITSIGECSFCGCTGLTSISIPNSITTIDYNAFAGCSSLISVIIPNSVKVIRSGAFSLCSSLESIEIPNSVTKIEGIFSQCTNLKNVIIPNSVTEIGDGAFYMCSSLEGITIPNSVTKIGNNAFYCCSSLLSIIIPKSVTTIEEYAFFNCTSLRNVRFYNELTTIGDVAFTYCSDELVIYGYEGSTAESYATDYRYGFELINEANSLPICGFYSQDGNPDHYDCAYTIDYDTTKRRGSLVVELSNKDDTSSSIFFPGDELEYYLHMMSSSYNINDVVIVVPFKDDVILKENTFTNMSEVETVTISATGGTIDTLDLEQNCFDQNAGIKSITTENISKVVYADSPVIQNATKTGAVFSTTHSFVDLSIITYPTCTEKGRKTQICSVCGAEGGEVDIAPLGHSYSSYEITNTPTCTEAGEKMAYCTRAGCNSIITEVLPARGHTIREVPEKQPTCDESGHSAYYKCIDCTHLFSDKNASTEIQEGDIEITKPLGHNLVHTYSKEPTDTENGNIDYWTCSRCTKYFSDKDGITEIEKDSWIIFSLKLNVSSIVLEKDIYAYDGLEKRPTIIIDGMVEGVDYSVSYSDNVEVGTAKAIITGIGKYSGTLTKEFYIISAPDAIAYGRCGDNLFWTLTDEGALMISGNGEMYNFHSSDLRSGWYDYLTSIKTVTIEGAENIGHRAFAGCVNLEHITFSNSVKVIGPFAFYQCYKLDNVILSDSISSINADTFRECTSLTQIVIPDGVKRINDMAFNGCTSLKSVQLPSSLKEIGYWAFSDCDCLTELTIPKNILRIWDGALPYGIQKITMLGDTPPTISVFSFGSVYDPDFIYRAETAEEIATRKLQIIVPYGSVDSYSSAEIWERYKSKIKGSNLTLKYNLSGSIAGYTGDNEIKVSITSVNDESNKYEVIAEGNAYALPDLAPGNYVLSVSAEGCVTRTFPLTVSGNTTQDVSIYHIGDVDMNGEIAAADVTRMARHIAKIQKIDDEYCYKLMDTDKNGEIESADVTHLAKYVAKIISSL